MYPNASHTQKTQAAAIKGVNRPVPTVAWNFGRNPTFDGWRAVLTYPIPTLVASYFPPQSHQFNVICQISGRLV